MIQEPIHIDEPHAANAYADVLSNVALQGRVVIVRRDGEDLAAVVPLEHLELMRDALARDEAEQIARTLDWKTLLPSCVPPQHWHDQDEPQPF